MEWLLLPAAAALAWYLGKRNGYPSSKTPPDTPPSEPPALTLKVKVFNGVTEMSWARVMGQATLKVGETKRAFRKYWWMIIAPPLWAIAQVNLTRTDVDNVIGTLILDGIPVWEGPLLESGRLVKYVKEIDIFGMTLPAVTIQAFQ